MSRKDQAETSVLFELIAARYERRCLLITANQPFGEWNQALSRPERFTMSVSLNGWYVALVLLAFRCCRRAA